MTICFKHPHKTPEAARAQMRSLKRNDSGDARRGNSDRLSVYQCSICPYPTWHVGHLQRRTRVNKYRRESRI